MYNKYELFNDTPQIITKELYDSQIDNLDVKCTGLLDKISSLNLENRNNFNILDKLNTNIISNTKNDINMNNNLQLDNIKKLFSDINFNIGILYEHELNKDPHIQIHI